MLRNSVNKGEFSSGNLHIGSFKYFNAFSAKIVCFLSIYIRFFWFFFIRAFVINNFQYWSKTKISNLCIMIVRLKVDLLIMFIVYFCFGNDSVYYVLLCSKCLAVPYLKFRTIYGNQMLNFCMFKPLRKPETGFKNYGNLLANKKFFMWSNKLHLHITM